MITQTERLPSSNDLEMTGASLPPVIEGSERQQISSELSYALRKLHSNEDHGDINVTRKEIINAAKELAGAILPNDRCKKIGIMPTTSEGSTHYPPLRNDVINLAYASEATHDETLGVALVGVIEELPSELQETYERALESSLQSDVPFEQALLELEASTKGLTSVAMKSRAVTFMDRVSLDTPLNHDNLNGLDIDDERMERLVKPIATGWLNGKRGADAHVPYIVFGYPGGDDGARTAGIYSHDSDK